MSRKMSKTKNLLIAGVLLALFALLLAGVMLWERAEQNEAPAPTVWPQTEPSAMTEQTVPTTVPTAVPTETTLPQFEPRRLNFLLVGRDYHEEGENGRSDSMILCSVDTGSGTVAMISFLRDIFVEIPGYRDNRLNAAYSLGGAELLKQTLKENFHVDVDVTLEIDFEGFQKMIDYLGGVEITLTAEEADHLGRGLTEGVNHLNGEQALAYSRIRKLDSDFGRTERQRNVLTALIEKYRTAGLQELLLAIDAFLDYSTSDHTDDELLAYALELYTMLGDCQLSSHRIPADGTWSYAKINGMSVLEVDLDQNRELLKGLLD